MPAGEELPLVERIDRVNAEIGAKQLELLRLIAEADRERVFEDHGARDMPHFVSMWLGVSWWKADRWVDCARALGSLPAIARALASGELSLDKVVELTRFATPEEEAALVAWLASVPRARSGATPSSAVGSSPRKPNATRAIARCAGGSPRTAGVS